MPLPPGRAARAARSYARPRPGSTIAAVAYDVELARRVRDLLAEEPGLAEKAMFGGLAFLLDGNMAVAASGQGGLMVRVDPDDSAELVRASRAYPLEMRGRSMPGWLRVDSGDVESDGDLRTWVRRGVEFARTLPAKEPGGKSRAKRPR
jgi:hypothetical protein